MNSPEEVSTVQPTRNFEYGQYAAFLAAEEREESAESSDVLRIL